jgi:hypothetical protein
LNQKDGLIVDLYSLLVFYYYQPVNVDFHAWVDAQNFLRYGMVGWVIMSGKFLRCGDGFICPGCSALDIEGGPPPMEASLWLVHWTRVLFIGGPFVLMDEFEEKSLWVKGRFGGGEGRGYGKAV